MAVIGKLKDGTTIQALDEFELVSMLKALGYKDIVLVKKPAEATIVTVEEK